MFVRRLVRVTRLIPIQKVHKGPRKKKKAADRLTPGGLLKGSPISRRTILLFRCTTCQGSCLRSIGAPPGRIDPQRAHAAIEMAAVYAHHFGSPRDIAVRLCQFSLNEFAMVGFGSVLE
jgi:hypothetical protein